MMKHIGVSGNRTGLSPQQREVLRDLTIAAQGVSVPLDRLTFHHGDCVGVDEQIHRMAILQRHTTHVHPPEDDKLRAFCSGHHSEPPKPYRTRNTDIVRASEVLWAFPEGPEESYPRSGTWMTVNIARKKGTPVTVVLPNGERTK